MKEKIIIVCFSLVLCIFNSELVFSGSLNEGYASFSVENSKHQLQGERIEYRFKEGNYPQKAKIIFIDKAEEDYSTPENAIVSRFSAIAVQDLSWWKKQWASKEDAEISLNRLTNNGDVSIKELLGRWKNIVEYRDIFLRKRILHNDYLIVMYRIVDKKSSISNGGQDLPIVFKKIGRHWKVSSGLSKSPLLGYSPWQSGKYKVDEDSIWVLGENNGL